MDVPLGNIGSAVWFPTIQDVLSGPHALNIDGSTGCSADTALQGAFNSLKCAFDSCKGGLNSTSSGRYLFCLGLKGPSEPPGQSFQGLLGAFAIFRVELSSRGRNSNTRVLSSAMTCNDFYAIANPPPPVDLLKKNEKDKLELKITYQIHYKKFNDENGIFVSSGFKLYSAP